MKKNNQYDHILSVAANLISQKGFNGVSFQQIADKTKLHKSSLFHYFKNKEELLLRILEIHFDKFYVNFQAIVSNHELEPEEKLRKAIDNHLTLMITYRANGNIFISELENLSIKNRRIYLIRIREYENNFQRIIAEMQTKGYFDGLDQKIVAFGILGMLNWVTRWYKKSGPLTIEEISNIFYRMVTKT